MRSKVSRKQLLFRKKIWLPTPGLLRRPQSLGEGGGGVADDVGSRGGGGCANSERLVRGGGGGVGWKPIF